MDSSKWPGCVLHRNKQTEIHVSFMFSFCVKGSTKETQKNIGCQTKAPAVLPQDLHLIEKTCGVSSGAEGTDGTVLLPPTGGFRRWCLPTECWIYLEKTCDHWKPPSFPLNKQSDG